MMAELMHPKFHVGTKVHIRPSHTDDAPTYYRWLNDREVTRWLLHQTPITLAVQEAWLKRTCAEDDPRTHFHFAIVRNDGDRHIGAVGLHSVNWIDRIATTGWVIGERDEWKKGYGLEAVTLLLRFAFSTLGLRKVTSATYAPNVGSNRIHEQCGYQRVGLRRAHVYRDGAYYDEILWELFAEEFTAIEQRREDDHRALVHATHPPFAEHEDGSAL